MNPERILSVLLAPRESEKTALIGEKHGQFVFRVVPDATGREVKKAVEQTFSVQVKKVNMVNVRGKVKRRLRGRTTRRPSWKKAYIVLAPGSEINLVS